MNYVFKPLEPHHWDWLNERVEAVLVSDTNGVACESKDGTILGVVALHSWTDNSVQVHIAADSPMCFKGGDFVYEVFNYVFNTAGRKIMLAMIPSDNHKSLKFNAHLGFEEITRIKDGFGDNRDVVITELRKENCKCLQDRTDEEQVA